jgi:hypothetical protein
MALMHAIPAATALTSPPRFLAALVGLRPAVAGRTTKIKTIKTT